MAAGLRLNLLDGFELRRFGEPIRLPLSSQRVIAFLALRGRPLRRTYVAGSLWPEATEGRASASLRSALWRIHRATPGLVRASRRQIGLNPRIKIDVREMLARTGGRGIDAPEEPDPGDLDPDDLAGDLLPDWYEDWVLAERERIRQARLHALEALCIQLTRAGRFAEAVDVGLSAVAGEPLRESAQRTLIEAFLAEGNRTEAVRQYTAYRRLLLDELGLEPSPAMASLVGA